MDAHISAMAPKITGNVIEVAVLDNQQVKAGQVLVRIDPRDYQAAVESPRQRWRRPKVNCGRRAFRCRG